MKDRDKNDLAQTLDKCWQEQLIRLEQTTLIDSWPQGLWQILIQMQPLPWILDRIAYLSSPWQRLQIYCLLWPTVPTSEKLFLVERIQQNFAIINVLTLRIDAIGLLYPIMPEQSERWLLQSLDELALLDDFASQTGCLGQIISLKLEPNLHKLVIERIYPLALQLRACHSTEYLLKSFIKYFVGCAWFEQARHLAIQVERDYKSPYGWRLLSNGILAAGYSAQQLLDWYPTEYQTDSLFLLINGLLEAQRLDEALEWLQRYPQFQNHAEVKTRLITACLKHDRLADAAKIAVSIAQSWAYEHPINQVIKAYLQHQIRDNALDLARIIDDPWQQIHGLVTIFRYDLRLELVQFNSLFVEAYSYVANLNYPELQAWSLFDLARGGHLLTEDQCLELIDEALEVANSIDDDDDYDRLILAISRYLIDHGRLAQVETTLSLLREPELIERFDSYSINIYRKLVQTQFSQVITESELLEVKSLVEPLLKRNPWIVLDFIYSLRRLNHIE